MKGISFAAVGFWLPGGEVGFDGRVPICVRVVFAACGVVGDCVLWLLWCFWLAGLGWRSVGGLLIVNIVYEGNMISFNVPF